MKGVSSALSKQSFKTNKDFKTAFSTTGTISGTEEEPYFYHQGIRSHFWAPGLHPNEPQFSLAPILGVRCSLMGLLGGTNKLPLSSLASPIPKRYTTLWADEEVRTLSSVTVDEESQGDVESSTFLDLLYYFCCCCCCCCCGWWNDNGCCTCLKHGA